MPTATRHEFLDMRVTDVRRVRDSARDHIVLLAESDGAHRLPIWIGRDEARPIALRLLEVGALSRPLTHDLAVSMVTALGGSLREVRIDRHRLPPWAARTRPGRKRSCWSTDRTQANPTTPRRPLSNSCAALPHSVIKQEARG